MFKTIILTLTTLILLPAAATLRSEPVMLSGTREVPEFQNLPAGTQNLGALKWQVPGTPGHTQGIVITPGEKLTGIKIGRKVTQLHFLHTLQAGSATSAWQQASFDALQKGNPPPERPVVLRYRVHYADGQTLEIPVRFGESIHNQDRDDFFNKPDGFFCDLLWARIVWHTPSGKGQGQVRTLYAMAWPNPRPETVVTAVDMEGVADNGAILFGLDADPTPLPGRQLYVSPEGKDSQTGSFEQPFATLEKALGTMQAGDTLYLRSGIYPLNQRLKLEKSGRHDAWIIVSAYPGETPVLDYNGFACQNEQPVDDWTPLASGQLEIGNHSYIRIQGLHLKNIISMGITAAGGSNVDVAGNTIQNAYHSGLFLGGKNIRATGNTLLWTCRTKTLREFVERFPELKKGKLVAEILATGKRYRHECLDIGGTGSDGLECAYNEIAWGDKESIDCKGGPANVKIHHNFAHNTSMWTGIYVDGWSQPLKNVEVYKNISYRGRGTGFAVASEGGSQVENVTLRDNLALECGYSGILISAAGNDGTKHNLRIENNTVVANGTDKGNPNPEGGIHLGSLNAKEAFVRNNICVNNRDYGIARDRPMDFASQKIVVSHNFISPEKQGVQGPVFPGNEKLKQWILEPGSPVTSGNPQFENEAVWNFRLKEGSPGIGTGLTADGKPCNLGAMP